MLFNSIDFFIFLFVVLPIFYFIPTKFRILFLLFASAFFYMYLIPVYILIMLGLILIDFTSARLMNRPKFESNQSLRNLIFSVSLSSTLSVLVYFKYFTTLAIPFGLSFHTFQGLGYIIEVYKNKFRSELSFQKYSLFVMFFPQLVAGPIEKPQNLLPQLELNQNFKFSYISEALPYIIWGLFKKIIISDRIGILVDQVFRNTNNLSSTEVLLGVCFFSIQVYCDFSGYSDIARGVAKLFGINLSLNFSFPFLSKSLIEFWRKFHMTLTDWFRSYVYFPLLNLFQKKSSKHEGLSYKIIALMTVFVLSGVWHGSKWTFVICAIIHGLICSIELIVKNSKFGKTLSELVENHILFSIFSRFYVFMAYTSGTLFFRSESLEQALLILKKIFVPHYWLSSSLNLDGYLVLTCFVLTVFLFLSEVIMSNYEKIQKSIPQDILFFLKSFILIFLLVFTLAFSPLQPNTFIYFQF